MDSDAADPPKSLTTRYADDFDVVIHCFEQHIWPSLRHKCSACFKQYKKKEHLVSHMRASYHSIHQPKCGVCQKHCKTFESLREHLTGPLSKENCSRIFADHCCSLCMKFFDSPASLTEHKEMCQLPAPAPLGTLVTPCTEYEIDISASDNGYYTRSPRAVALDCEMVGGESDGSLDLCARVCLIDEDENLIFHTYVRPETPVTNYRHLWTALYEITGITEHHLRDAMPLEEVSEQLLQILYNGEAIGRLRWDGGNARLLVGHDIQHDLQCLKINYPDRLVRDTAKYRPFMKTNLVSHSLKYLTQTYLGQVTGLSCCVICCCPEFWYEIQAGVHDPFVDCVSVMRLYKRMRAQNHHIEELGTFTTAQNTQNSLPTSLDSWDFEKLESMTPDELFQISKLNYKCWCLDSRPELKEDEELHLGRGEWAPDTNQESQAWPDWPQATGLKSLMTNITWS
ncbi:hypothetical protein RHGRI_002975 [Rhododendron griersonianum]|uniref:RNA exonuclease 4 n=1 Tax=Rhododendron griersonianum TaxID=479676 RepID=A0AAV6LTT3_9ERIC|nr:hypothetical protein RHGRI_002975 [Rhododendron griersonianum]